MRLFRAGAGTPDEVEDVAQADERALVLHVGRQRQVETSGTGQVQEVGRRPARPVAELRQEFSGDERGGIRLRLRSGLEKREQRTLDRVRASLQRRGIGEATPRLQVRDGLTGHREGGNVRPADAGTTAEHERQEAGVETQPIPGQCELVQKAEDRGSSRAGTNSPSASGLPSTMRCARRLAPSAGRSSKSTPVATPGSSPRVPGRRHGSSAERRGSLACPEHEQDESPSNGGKRGAIVSRGPFRHPERAGLGSCIGEDRSCFQTVGPASLLQVDRFCSVPRLRFISIWPDCHCCAPPVNRRNGGPAGRIAAIGDRLR